MNRVVSGTRRGLAGLAAVGAVFSPAACARDSTPEASPPAANGAVVFRADFETGDVSQWNWGAQCANTSSAPLLFKRGTITVQREVVAQGDYAARIDLPSSPSEPSACESVRRRKVELSEEWYAFEFRLPANFVTAGWFMIGQFNYQGIHGPPVGIHAAADNVRLIMQTGFCEPPPGPCTWSSGDGGNVPPLYVVPPSRFATDVWHQVLLHVKWRTGNDGLVETFHRRRGEADWAHTAAFAGKPTLQEKAGYVPAAEDTSIDKIGAYRGRSPAALSVWHDSFCVATTRTAAETCL